MQTYKDYVLRGMQESDLKTVWQWRNADRIRLNMYSSDVIAWEDHCKWYARNEHNETIRYYILELAQRPIGVVNFTAIDRKANRCDWGFYLGETDTPRGSGTMLGILGLMEAFESLHIRKLCAEVLAFNEASLRFHSKLGFTYEGRLLQHVWKHGKYEDIVLFAFFSDQWPAQRERLMELLN